MTQRALVLGYGHMGHYHARALRDLGYLVTTVDPRDDSGARWRGIPPGSYYEAGVVATPIMHLAECAVEAERVCNKLLIEKPGASSSEQMRELRTAIGLSQPAVGYTERFNPMVRAVLASSTPEQRREWSASFVRWSDRPTPDVWLDLLSHDVDLFTYLGLREAEYSYRAEHVERVRRVTFTDRDDNIRYLDLMAHNLSPLHAQWHAFFAAGKPGLATLRDAEKVLQEVEEVRRYDREKAAA